MAKKKNRSANIARKREKRNRNRKFKNKQLAIEKQRRSSYGNLGFNEERILTCLINGADLFEEPEFDDLYFDFDDMHVETIKLISVLLVSMPPDSDINIEITTSEDKEETDPNILRDKIVADIRVLPELFTQEVILKLVTPKFMESMFSVLEACENRFRQIGDHDKADAARVTLALFKNITLDEIVQHPLIQDIGIKTLQAVVEQPEILTENNPNIREVISDVLEVIRSNSQQDEIPSNNIISDILEKKSAYVNEVPETVDEEYQKDIDPVDVEVDTLGIPNKSGQNVSKPIPTLNSLPAKALYKNNDGLAIKNILNGCQGYTLENETPTQLDYYNEDHQFYITATNNRLKLHAYSEQELTLAMEALETHCQSALMYLAKTYDEGGEIDGTE